MQNWGFFLISCLRFCELYPYWLTTGKARHQSGGHESARCGRGVTCVSAVGRAYEASYTRRHLCPYNKKAPHSHHTLFCRSIPVVVGFFSSFFFFFLLFSFFRFYQHIKVPIVSPICLGLWKLVTYKSPHFDPFCTAGPRPGPRPGPWAGPPTFCRAAGWAFS